MRRLVPIFLALFAATTLAMVMVVITRTGSSWPRSIRAIDWRRLTGATEDEASVSVETPAG